MKIAKVYFSIISVSSGFLFAAALLFATSCSIQHNSRSLTSDSQCKTWETEIIAEWDQLRWCETDSDCIDLGMQSPFYCGPEYFNKNVNQDTVFQTYRDYNNQCNSDLVCTAIMYGPPTCQNNRCVPEW